MEAKSIITVSEGDANKTRENEFFIIMDTNFPE